MDYGKVLSTAFSGWTQDRVVFRNMIFLALVSLLSAIAVFLPGTIFFGSTDAYMEWALSGSTFPYPQWELGKALVFLLLLAVVGIVVFFVQSIFRGRILRQALLKYRNVAPFDTGKGIRLALLQIAISLVALFCWYNKKWLLLLLAGIVLVVTGAVWGITAAGVACIIIGVMVLLVYLGVVLYNSLRLGLADAIFVEKEKSIFQAAREAWEIGHNRVFSLLVAFFILGLVLGIALLLLSVPALIFQFLAGTQNSLVGTTFIVLLITNLITVALNTAISDFGLAEIYRQAENEPRPLA